MHPDPTTALHEIKSKCNGSSAERDTFAHLIKRPASMPNALADLAQAGVIGVKEKKG